PRLRRVDLARLLDLVRVAGAQHKPCQRGRAVVNALRPTTVEYIAEGRLVRSAHKVADLLVATAGSPDHIGQIDFEEAVCCLRGLANGEPAELLAVEIDVVLADPERGAFMRLR